MISPERLGRLSAKVAGVFSSLEIDMLIDAATALATTDILSPAVIAKKASELTSKLSAMGDDNLIATGLMNDFKAMFVGNAAAEAARANANANVRKKLKTDAGIKSTASGYALASDLLKMKAGMKESARDLYLQEAARAGLNARSGRMSRTEAINTAVRNMADQGLYSYKYTRADGVEVKVPVDVGVRRRVEDMAQQFLTEQVLDVANELGENLIQVSSHAGARDSHAAWHGRVYSLRGGNRKYPNFYSACHVGDMVRGYGGYNCRHTIAIYREGEEPLWPADPSEGTGYTNDEIYALKQRQRALENNIRKLKRTKQVLDAQGIDTLETDIKIRANQAALRALVKGNSRVLARDSWREQVLHNAKQPTAEPATPKQAAKKPENELEKKLQAAEAAVATAKNNLERAQKERDDARSMMVFGEGSFDAYKAAADRLKAARKSLEDAKHARLAANMQYVNSRPYKLNDSLDLYKSVEKSHVDMIRKLYDDAPEFAKRVWSVFERDMQLLDGQYKRGAHCTASGEIGVNMNMAQDFDNNRIGKAGETYFHEFAHNIDWIAGRVSLNYKKGVFGHTLRKELEGAAVAKQKEAKSRGAELAKDLDLDTLQAEGYIGSFTRREIEDLIAAGADKKQVVKEIKRSAMYKGKTSKAAGWESLIADVREATGNSNGSTNDAAISDISDMISAITKDKHNIGWHHSASYWKQKEKFYGKDSGLAIEAFAEMYSAHVANDESLKTLEKYVPESIGVYREMMEYIGTNADYEWDEANKKLGGNR